MDVEKTDLGVAVIDATVVEDAALFDKQDISVPLTTKNMVDETILSPMVA